MASAAAPSAILAVGAHWVGVWAPVSGLVQHGMVQMGGDRYAYLPDIAFVPLVAAALAAMLGREGEDEIETEAYKQNERKYHHNCRSSSDSGGGNLSEDSASGATKAEWEQHEGLFHGRYQAKETKGDRKKVTALGGLHNETTILVRLVTIHPSPFLDSKF